MPRFVARYRAYSHGVRPGIEENIAPGQTRTLVRELEANFDHRGIRDYEKEAAIKALRFPGLPEDRQTGGNTSPVSRLSVFDSESAAKQYRWTQEEHDLVVEALRESPAFKLEFIEVSAPKLPVPWNGYDGLEGVDQIMLAVEATGIDPADVLAYERENAKRSDVVDALKELLGIEAEDEEIVVQA